MQILKEETFEQMEQRVIKELSLITDKKMREEALERAGRVFLNYEGEDKIISSLEAKELSDIERKSSDFRIMTHIPELDNIIGGFRNGNLVVISGAPKQGKTAFMRTLTHNFSEDENESLWFTYEVPIGEFLDLFGKIPLFYVPCILKGNTLEWLEKRILESKAKYGTRIVFVDHLGFICDMNTVGRGMNQASELSNTMRGLKKMALRNNVVIFLAHHIRKTTIDKVPELEDLKDSSGIAQEADIVMFVKRLKDEKRPEEWSDYSAVYVKAHRRTGKTGKVKLLYTDNKFKEVLEQTYENYG